jgi:serpin B
VLADSDDTGDGGPKVRFANTIWVDDAAARLKDDYARVVAEHYRAQARTAYFKTMVSLAVTAGLVY